MELCASRISVINCLILMWLLLKEKLRNFLIDDCLSLNKREGRLMEAVQNIGTGISAVDLRKYVNMMSQNTIPQQTELEKLLEIKEG